MNTPNKLTLARICVVPIFIYFLLSKYIESRFFISALIFAFAAITDYFDGWLARKSGQITNLGKFLDPLADKILVMSAFLCFIELSLVKALPIIILLTREFLVISVRLVCAKKGQVIAANFWGKLKTVSQIFAILVVLILEHILIILRNKNLNEFINLDQVAFSFYLLEQIFIWVCVIFSLVSGILYMFNNRKFLLDIE